MNINKQNIITVLIFTIFFNLIMYGFKTYLFKVINNKNDNPYLIEGSKNAKTGPKVLGFSLVFMAVEAP